MVTRAEQRRRTRRMSVVRGRQSARRSLFGPVDHAQLRRDLELQLWEMTQQDSRRWNFNFQRETPLPGSLEWEEIPAHRATAFYLEHAQMGGVGAPQPAEDGEPSRAEESAGADQENCGCVSNKRPAETTPPRSKRSLSKADPPITDYFPKRRRPESRMAWNPPQSCSRDAPPSRNIKSMLL